MTNREVGLQSRFWKQHPVDTLMDKSDEEIIQLVDEYLDGYIKRFNARNGINVPLPDWFAPTFNEIRNKRTNISKKPKISRNKGAAYE